MKDVIKLRSWGGVQDFLKKIELKDDCKTYQFMTVYNFRYGYIKGRNFIILSRGSLMIEGGELKEAKAVIKSIKFRPMEGVFITFE